MATYRNTLFLRANNVPKRKIALGLGAVCGLGYQATALFEAKKSSQLLGKGGGAGVKGVAGEPTSS